jgi:hypothetical protein
VSSLPTALRASKSTGTIFAYGQTGTGKTFTMNGASAPHACPSLLFVIVGDLSFGCV